MKKRTQKKIEKLKKKNQEVEAKKVILKRKSTRFASDYDTYALIDYKMETAKFDPEIVAIPYSEAMKGCAVITRNGKFLEEGTICRVQVGEVAPLRAEVAWKKILDSDTIKVGFKFLE